jgi:DEAD/DEAH box helicase domain-containing protein
MTYDKPQQSVNLRLIDPVSIDIIDETRGRIIDNMTYSRAFFEAFEGSVFWHQAQQFLITKLDIVSKQASCRPVKVNYNTTAKNDTIITIIRQTGGQGNILSFGTVKVLKVVEGFVKRDLVTREIIEEGEFKLPPLEMETQAIWIDIPLKVRRALEERGFDIWASLHAANHVLVTVAAVESLCDAGDIDCEHFPSFSSSPSLQGSKSMRLLLYDRRPGGLGICEKLLEAGQRTLKAAHSLLQGCRCEELQEVPSFEDEEAPESCGEGCPACLLDPKCSVYNENLAKPGALLLLSLLSSEMSAQATGAQVRMRPEGAQDGDALAASSSSVPSPREERRLMLARQARFQDTHSSRGLFVTSSAWAT